ERIIEMVTMTMAKVGETIIKEGDIGEQFYMIVRGIADVYTKHNGKNKKIAVLEKGDFFGEIALLYNKPRNSTVKARTYCDMLVLQRDIFQELMEEFPELKKRIMKIINHRLKQ